MPRKVTELIDDARSMADCARPSAIGNPNFESVIPVWRYSCVCASIPGLTRMRTSGARNPEATSASILANSSKESTTIRLTPASSAISSSRTDLLFPCITSLSAGTPAARAMNISPPVETSMCMPASYAIRAIALHRKAFDAYATPGPKAATASSQRSMSCCSSYMKSGDPYSATRSVTLQPPTVRPSSPTAAELGSRSNGTGEALTCGPGSRYRAGREADRSPRA